MLDYKLNDLILEAYSKIFENALDDKMYIDVVSKNDVGAIETLLSKAAEEHGYSKIAYRVDDDIDRHGYLFSNTNGIFFAENLGYYKNSDTGYNAETANKYVIFNGTRLWKPLDEIQNSYAYSWSDIRLPLSEAEKYGIEDENDEPDVYEGGEASTSTEGLALAAKRLGYDGIEITVPQSYCSGDFTEYAIFDSKNVKLMEVTYDDDGNLIPLSRRFDSSSYDMRY